MKWFYVISAVVVAALAASPFLLLPKENTAELAGKVVAYSTYGAKVKSIDPATCGDTMSAGIQGNIYEGLYGYDFLRRPVELTPLLAEAMPEVSEDLKTYTIRVRKGIYYHRNPCFGLDAGGNPRTRTVRAEDFVLAIKRISDYHIQTQLALAFIIDRIVGIEDYYNKTKGYAKGDFRRYDLPLEGVTALDEHTLQIRLTEPFPQLLYVLAIHNFAPFPREIIDYYLTSEPGKDGARVPLSIKERDPEIHEIQAVVGTGAYYLAKWVKGSKIVLMRNPDFRHETYPAPPDLATLTDEQRRNAEEDIAAGLYQDAGKTVPFTDVRYLQFVAEVNPMWMLFLTRQVDTAGVPRELFQEVIGPDRELTAEWAQRGIRLIKYSSPAVYWYGFNLEDPVLGASKSLRQAMTLCFNVEEEIEVLHNGRGIRATTYVPSSFEGHDQAPSPYARFDVAAARTKLADARRELIAAGVIAPDEPIPPITLSMGGRDVDFRKMGEFSQEQFRQIGLDVRIELNDWPTLQEKVHNKVVQMYSMGWHADYPDPENFLQLYYGPNIKRGTNNCNYANPAFDALYEKASKMMPSPQRTALYVQMLKMLNEDCPALLLSEPISFVLVQPWVHNVKPHPIGYGFSMYQRIDVDMRRRMGGR